MYKIIMGLLLAFLLLGCSNAKDTSNNAEKTRLQKEASRMKEHKSGEWSPDLSEAEKETLFAITEDTLEWCVGKSKEQFSFNKYDITEKMKEATHTFVTLKISGDLRGCIGSLPPYPAEALYRSVHANAFNAAMRDGRFRQVTKEELESIDVHISMLSPVKKIESVDEFVLGQHGIILQKGDYRSVFLPEVAIEQKWSKETTLAYLSSKAGMNPDDWQSGAEFSVFESVVLSK